ncbi:MAG: hypothetical protein WDA60_10340 [Acidimicrobiia bacterium]|jgi:hypothetical protein
MARSRNKHSRAALRAKSRRPRKQGSSRWFTVTITVIILVGVIGVVLASGVLSRGDSASAAPQPPTADNPSGDHWHAALAVNVCGEWLTPPAEFETAAGNSNVRVGIHTHGDGFIHIHPFTSSEAGSKATLGKFFDYGGWSVSPSSFAVWTGPSVEPTKTEWKNGDKCPNATGEAGKGKAGEVVFEVNCKTVGGNPSDHKLADQEVVAIGFLPKGEEMGAPPNAASAPQDDGSPSGAINQKGCTPTAQNNPGVADTTPTTAAATTPTTQQ